MLGTLLLARPAGTAMHSVQPSCGLKSAIRIEMERGIHPAGRFTAKGSPNHQKETCVLNSPGVTVSFGGIALGKRGGATESGFVHEHFERADAPFCERQLRRDMSGGLGISGGGQ
jgi:hypothetical protein